MNFQKIRYAMVEKSDLRIESISSNSDSDGNQNNSSQDEGSLPRLYVKLEKIDKLSQNSKAVSKSVPELNGTVYKTANITSTSSENSNQKDNCKDVNPAIHIKQEKVNSAPNTRELSSNIHESRNVNTPAIAQRIKQENISKSKPHSTKNVSQETSTSSLSKTILPKSPRIQSKTGPKPPSNKMPNCSKGKPGTNFMPFNGAAFIHTQIRTNTALQTILKDIITLNEEYKYTNDHLLDEEIDKLRVKNNLPSLRTGDDFIHVDNSDFTEDSDRDSDYEGQRSGSQDSERYGTKFKYMTEQEEEDDSSDKLIINELDNESEDEPELVVIEKGCLKKKEKLMNRVFINGDLVEIDSDIPECPVCAKVCKSINALKQHIKNCSTDFLLQKDITKDDARVSSKLSNLKIARVFSVGAEMFKCAGSYCEFIGTKSQIDKHQILHSKPFRRTCKECDIIFFNESSLEKHFESTGHSQVYPPVICEYCDNSYFERHQYKKHMFQRHGKRQKTHCDTPELNDAEITEVDDE